MIPSSGELEWLWTNSLGEYWSRDDLEGKKILKLQEKSQGMILWEHKLLFHGQIKNYLTRKLISCLRVSFLKARHALQGKWQNQCAFWDPIVLPTCCVLEQVTSHLSGSFSSVKQSIWIRQSLKFFPPGIPSEVSPWGWLSRGCHTHLLTQWLRSWCRWCFHFIETMVSLLQCAALGFHPRGVEWSSARTHSATSVCLVLWHVLKGWPWCCSWGACSAIGESHKHMKNGKRSKTSLDLYILLTNETKNALSLMEHGLSVGWMARGKGQVWVGPWTANILFIPIVPFCFLSHAGW